MVGVVANSAVAEARVGEFEENSCFFRPRSRALHRFGIIPPPGLRLGLPSFARVAGF
jgi:hypothetical protein